MGPGAADLRKIGTEFAGKTPHGRARMGHRSLV